MDQKIVLAVLIFFSLCFANCGSNTDESSSGSSVIILNQSFIPNALTVSAGDTVTFLNHDSVLHQILSQSSENQFDDTEVFDSQPIPPGSLGEITVPEDLSGTILYFYCGLHKADMLTPNGTITVLP